MNPRIIDKLRSIVGPECVSDEYEERVCFIRDAAYVSKEGDVPDVVVAPGTPEEVSKVLSLAQEEGFPVIPRGAGSNLSGGALPVEGSAVMVLTRLNRILEINPRNLSAVVEAGVVTGEFQAEAEKLGLFYPPDPASLAFCTIGGNVAECAGGPRGVKYGVTRDYVLGLEVVLPGGDIITTGARTMKSVSGYDLTRLFVGSEGTLGVVTKAVLRLIPKPEAQRALLVGYDNVVLAAETVSDIIAHGIVPACLELMDQVSVQSIEEYKPTGLPVNAGAVLLIEVDGPARALEEQLERIGVLASRRNPVVLRLADTPEEREELWLARRSAFAAVARRRPTVITEDITVPRDKLPEMVSIIQDTAAQYGVMVCTVAHAGDGNLHAVILTDERDPDEVQRVEKTVDRWFRGALDLGGTLTGEHGIGVAKARYLPLEAGGSGLELMRRIKRTFDPHRILNPRNMLGEP